MNLSNEYIRGLVEGEGCFTFYSGKKEKIPAFALSMHFRDRDLISAVRDTLKLKNRVYIFRTPSYGFKKPRGHKAVLVARDFPSLKNIIVPFFYKKLKGNKASQFESWIEKMGTDPLVPARYNLIYRLYKNGFYDRNFLFD